MYFLEKIKNSLADELNLILGDKLVSSADFVYPPNAEMGDLSLPCFALAKKLEKNPMELARELVSSMQDSGLAKCFKTAGPYLNIDLKTDELFAALSNEIRDSGVKYGENNIGQQKRVMIEYSNANTHKEYHIGHLRNLCYGDAVNRLLGANGYVNIPVSYINDFGIHIAKTLWAYLEFYRDVILPENKGKFLGDIYVRSTREMEESKTAKGLVSLIMKKIESRQGEEYKLWQETRLWSIEQFENIYQELGVEFVHTFYESEEIDSGREMVDNLLKKDVLKISEGAVIADLESENLGVLMFLRSDGTALYPVADLPLASKKFDDFQLDESIYVVDIRQGLYFKQLFNVLQKLGYEQKMVHLGYDVVKLPTGMMSSRLGNVITYEDLRDQIFDKLRKETGMRHMDWDIERIENVVRVITNGAIKFEMIKIGAEQIITFDIEKSLSFTGFTAAYLQYTYARIHSIIRKSEIALDDLRIDVGLSEQKEHELLVKLAKYPEAIERAGREYNPSELAKYLFDLSQLFNDYYHSVQILKSEEKEKQAKLILINSVSQIIKNGLNLLGIGVVEEM